MRAFALALVCFVASLASAFSQNNVLILIPTGSAGPAVDIHTYTKGEWALWPARTGQSGNNRLLSILSGVDWVGESGDLKFRQVGNTWQSTNYESLQRRGYFSARHSIIGKTRTALITNAEGSAKPEAMFLALNDDSAFLEHVGINEVWPPDRLLIYEALGWDDAEMVARKAGGRAIEIEYPPELQNWWTQVWFKGRGWPNGLPNPDQVPGLIPSSRLGALLISPQSLTWTRDDSAHWGGANRWLEHIRGPGTIVFMGIGFLTLAIVSVGVYIVLSEKRSLVIGAFLAFVSIIPSVVVVAGWFTRLSGLAGWPIWLILAAVCVSGLSAQATLLQRKFLARAHPLFACSVVQVLLLATLDPKWGEYSPVFGWIRLETSPEVVGALFASMVGIVAFSRGTGANVRSAIWAFMILLTLFGFVAQPAWTGGHSYFALLPLVALAAGEQWLLPLGLLVGAFGVCALVPALTHGYAWMPGGLIHNISERGAVDISRYAQFLFSPAFLGSVFTAIALSLIADRFFFHQLRKLLRTDLRLRGVLCGAAAALVIGLVQPLLLHGALVACLGSLLVLLFDGVRTL